MKNHKFSNSSLAHLKARLDAVEKRINQRENRRVTTSPLYNDANLLTGDAVEGQVIIDTITTPGTPLPKFRWNGQWWLIRGVHDLAARYYTDTYQSIPAFNLKDIDLVHKIDPSALFDNPLGGGTHNLSALQSGLYAVMIYALVPNANLSASHYIEIEGFSPNAQFGHTLQAIETAVGSTADMVDSFQFIDWFEVGDYIDFRFRHDDSSAVNFYGDVTLRKLYT